jgi:cobalamin biosynthesis Mg chelatase CobN
MRTPLISRDEVVEEADDDEWQWLIEEGGRAASAPTILLLPPRSLSVTETSDQTECRMEETKTTTMAMSSRSSCTNAATTIIQEVVFHDITKYAFASSSTKTQSLTATSTGGTRNNPKIEMPQSVSHACTATASSTSLQKYFVFLAIILGNVLVAWIVGVIFFLRLPQ